MRVRPQCWGAPGRQMITPHVTSNWRDGAPPSAPSAGHEDPASRRTARLRGGARCNGARSHVLRSAGVMTGPLHRLGDFVRLDAPATSQDRAALGLLQGLFERVGLDDRVAGDLGGGRRLTGRDLADQVQRCARVDDRGSLLAEPGHERVARLLHLGGVRVAGAVVGDQKSRHRAPSVRFVAGPSGRAAYMVARNRSGSNGGEGG